MKKKRLTRNQKHTLRLIARYAEQKTQSAQLEWSKAELEYARMRSHEEWGTVQKMQRAFALLTEGQHERINQQLRDGKEVHGLDRSVQLSGEPV